MSDIDWKRLCDKQEAIIIRQQDMIKRLSHANLTLNIFLMGVCGLLLVLAFGGGRA